MNDPIFFDQKLSTDIDINSTEYLKKVLGGKGYYLNRMTSHLNLPVPHGFTIDSTWTTHHQSTNTTEIQSLLSSKVHFAMERLEKLTKHKFGENLMVSVRSGAAVSMPGMMDTILNVGLNDETVELLAAKTNPLFAWDSYRRFIQMYGSTVLGIDSGCFTDCYDVLKTFSGGEIKNENLLKVLVKQYKKILTEFGHSLPHDPYVQLNHSILAVFRSWYAPKAKAYRKIENIDDKMGTAVNIQQMVYGNLNEKSGTGVVFSRNPNSGAAEFFGDFLINAQGEDVVDGSHNPLPIISMMKMWPDVYTELRGYVTKLEKEIKNIVDVEFTVEDGNLYILQAREGKCSSLATVNIVMDLFTETKIGKQDAINILTKTLINTTTTVNKDGIVNTTLIGTGLPASPGKNAGVAVFTSDAAVDCKQDCILIRPQTDPQDITGIAKSKGIITSTGGLVSHAAVIARSWNLPCIVGVKELKIVDGGNTATLNGITIKEGDLIILDGTTGEIFIEIKP